MRAALRAAALALPAEFACLSLRDSGRDAAYGMLSSLLLGTSLLAVSMRSSSFGLVGCSPHRNRELYLWPLATAAVLVLGMYVIASSRVAEASDLSGVTWLPLVAFALHEYVKYLLRCCNVLRLARARRGRIVKHLRIRTHILVIALALAAAAAAMDAAPEFEALFAEFAALERRRRQLQLALGERIAQCEDASRRAEQGGSMRARDRASPCSFALCAAVRVGAEADAKATELLARETERTREAAREAVARAEQAELLLTRVAREAPLQVAALEAQRATLDQRRRVTRLPRCRAFFLCACLVLPLSLSLSPSHAPLAAPHSTPSARRGGVAASRPPRPCAVRTRPSPRAPTRCALVSPPSARAAPPPPPNARARVALRRQRASWRRRARDWRRRRWRCAWRARAATRPCCCRCSASTSS
jgi:hypothetical protein